MSVVRACIIAFGTYSHIPMPQTKEDSKAMNYAICFFPMIGIVIGGLWLLWFYVAEYFGMNILLKAAGGVLIPIFITGGIHLDGFCDVTDAFSSWQSRERKLEILKDPHVGAFAIIGCGCYFIADFAIMGTVSFTGTALVLCCTFVVSRALSSLALLYFKGARPKGMLDAFASTARKKAVTITSIIYLAVMVAVMAVMDWRLMLAAVISEAVCFWYYHHKAYKVLGGTTGDMAGWFVQITELVVPVVVCALWGILSR